METKTSPATSISEALEKLSAQMHASGVTMLKAKSGDFEVELHVPVPRVLSPLAHARTEVPEPGDPDEAADEPEWKRQAAALDRELELG